jgi:hypothetical protein
MSTNTIFARASMRRRGRRSGFLLRGGGRAAQPRVAFLTGLVRGYLSGWRLLTELTPQSTNTDVGRNTFGAWGPDARRGPSDGF